MSVHLAPEEVTRRLHLVLDAATDLPLHDVEQMEDLIQVGERTVALGNLCTQLYEYDIRLPLDLKETLASVGRQLAVPAQAWERVEFNRDQAHRQQCRPSQQRTSVQSVTRFLRWRLDIQRLTSATFA